MRKVAVGKVGHRMVEQPRRSCSLLTPAAVGLGARPRPMMEQLGRVASRGFSHLHQPLRLVDVTLDGARNHA